MKKDDLCYQDTDHLFFIWSWVNLLNMDIKELSFFVCLVHDHISPCLFCLVNDMRVDTKSITIKNKLKKSGWFTSNALAVLSISFKTNCKKSETRITATASILKQYIQTHEKVECLFNITPQNVQILGVQNTVFIVWIQLHKKTPVK